MLAAGVDATFDFYPGLAHWFFESDRPEYNPAAADLAWQRTVDFFKQNL
jgi:carboxymethylenebutenolidase